jgi:hypothetical protein
VLLVTLPIRGIRDSILTALRFSILSITPSLDTVMYTESAFSVDFSTAPSLATYLLVLHAIFRSRSNVREVCYVVAHALLLFWRTDHALRIKFFPSSNTKRICIMLKM